MGIFWGKVGKKSGKSGKVAGFYHNIVHVIIMMDVIERYSRVTFRYILLCQRYAL